MLNVWRVRVCILFLASWPLVAAAQGPIPPARTQGEPLRSYQNSPDGLRLQLQDALDVARQGNTQRLQSSIRQMEIPDYRDWFANAYGGDLGNSYAGYYSRDLAKNENNLQALLQQLANESGDIGVRIVNDAPAPGMEEHMLDGLQGGTEVFFASWKRPESLPGTRSNAIGYFVFISRSFRLLTGFPVMPARPAGGPAPVGPRGSFSAPGARGPDNFSSSDAAAPPPNGPMQPGVRIASPPRCDYCPNAGYSDEARRKRLQGSVLLQLMVQPDGSATDLQVVRSPAPELSQMALDSVGTWRFVPARSADGDAVAYREAVEVNFRLPN